MQRIAIWNLFFGFLVIFFGAAAGALVANDLTNSFIDSAESLPTLMGKWKLVIQSSAHGHTNLFGLIHIVTGLTMPYVRFEEKIKLGITCGLTLGVVAMGPLMIWRSFLQPIAHYDLNGVLIGICLAAALLATGIQTAGLWLAFQKRR